MTKEEIALSTEVYQKRHKLRLTRFEKKERVPWHGPLIALKNTSLWE